MAVGAVRPTAYYTHACIPGTTAGELFFYLEFQSNGEGEESFFFTFLSYLALFSTHAEKKRKFVVASLTRLSQVVFCCRAADTLGAEQRGGDRAKKIKRNRRVLEERKPPPPCRELIIDE